MKKLIFPVIFTISIGLNFYLLSGDSELLVSDDLDDALYEEVNDQISVAQSAIKKTDLLAHKKSHHKQNIKVIENEINTANEPDHQDDRGYSEDKASEDFERNYEQSKLKWDQDSQDYFERELGLRIEAYETYLELQKLREKEVSNYMTPKIEDANGEPYLFTLEDNIEIGKINSKYLKQLKDTMGAESYERYINFRQNYNKKLITSGNAHFYVEF